MGPRTLCCCFCGALMPTMSISVRLWWCGAPDVGSRNQLGWWNTQSRYFFCENIYPPGNLHFHSTWSPGWLEDYFSFGMAYFQGLLLLVSGSVYVPGSKLPPISMSGRVTTPLVGFFVPYGFPIKDGMTIPHIATFDPGTNKHYKLTFMITLEVNHHIKKGVSFWMLINPYYKKWWLFKKSL